MGDSTLRNEQNKSGVMRYTKILALSLSLVLLGTACSKDRDQVTEPSTQTNTQTAGVGARSLRLTLEGLEATMPEGSAETSQARAMAFEISDAGPKLKMTEEKMESVAVIANADQSVKHYVKIEWSKEAGKNRLYVEDYEVTHTLDNTALQLTAGQDWYIMGYVGGTYDHATKRVSFNPNGEPLKAGANGQVIKKAVPVVFPWTKLTVKTQNGKDYAATAIDQVQFKALGTILRVTLKNSFGQDIRLKGLRLLSNALRSGSGYYDLSSSKLPALTETALPKFTFHEQLNTTPNSYFRSINQPTYAVQNNDGSANVDVTNGATSASFLIWAMPDASAPQRPVTHVLANISRLKDGVEQNEPKMETLYVWGTNRVFAERSRQLIRANAIRHKMSLEYFAKNYLGLGTEENITVSASSMSNAQRAERQSTDIELQGYTNIPRFGYTDVTGRFAITNNWSIPLYREARGLFMVDLGDVTNGSDKALSIAPTTSQVRRTITQEVMVNGEAKTYTDTYIMGSTIYALRFDNAGDGRKLYSAWRYSYNEAPNRAALIEAVYLGPNFKGTIDDIIPRGFWETHRADLIERRYVSSYYAYVDARSSAVDQTIKFMETLPDGSKRPLTAVNFWVRHEDGIPNLVRTGTNNNSRADLRVWAIGHEPTKYMGHRQIMDGSGFVLEHYLHVIGLQPKNTLWKDNN